jgi:rfaE bifunctional protein kinase chain/domain
VVRGLRRAITKARVLVVGDVMLDRYWFGDVSRISPEAPVPVVKVAREEVRPGGAGNVALNAAALGAHVTLLSVVGTDEAGRRLRDVLKADGVRCRLLADRTVTTTVKLRVIGRQQQLLRADFESPPHHDVLRAKLADFTRLLADHDVVVLSDYGKGGLTHIERMIGMAKRRRRTVLVDPKGEDYARYRGATLVTPNREEFQSVVGVCRNEREFTERAQRLRKSMAAEALLVTRSAEGMTLFQRASRLHVPTQAREVYDVTGAGDTVIATLGVMLAAGCGLAEAVRIANRAAGIVVGKFGTAVVTPDELFGRTGGDRTNAG